MKQILVVYPKRYKTAFKDCVAFFKSQNVPYVAYLSDQEIQDPNNQWVMNFTNDATFAKGMNFDLVYDLQGNLSSWGGAVQTQYNWNTLAPSVKSSGKVRVFHV